MPTRPRPHLTGQTAYLASADPAGVPHLTVGEILKATARTLRFRGWLCPRTLQNLEHNDRVAVAVGLGPEGLQFVGSVVERSVDAVRDGYGAEDREAPRVRYRLLIRVTETLAMTDEAHTDRPLK